MVNKAKLAAMLGMIATEGPRGTMLFRKSPEPTFGVPRGNTRRRWPAEPTYCIRCGEPKPENKAFCSATCCRLWKKEAPDREAKKQERIDKINGLLKVK